MIKFNIESRYTGKVQFTAEIECDDDAPIGIKIGLAVKWGIKSGANLSGADLSRVDLSGADLSYADLSRAYLSYADLSGANLSCADLSRAYLSRASLSGADLSGANLSYADLSRVDLSGVDLSGADLSYADLSYADLSGADLSGADLSYADLSYADLSGAKGVELAIAKTRILPDGDLVGWKKCCGGVIVKLRIPEASKRSHAFGRKCRAEYADVIDIIGGGKAISSHDNKTEYVIGQRVMPDKFDENWQNECAGGIHFFITRLEAEAYDV